MKVLRWLAFQLFLALGWKFVGDMPQRIKKAVLIVAPHTSNWDGFYGLLFCFVKQLPVKFAVKKEAMIFPIGPLLKWMGAIPIDRKRKSKSAKTGSMVQHMTALAAAARVTDLDLWFTLQATMIRTSSRYRLFTRTKWASTQRRARSTRRASAFRLKDSPLG